MLFFLSGDVPDNSYALLEALLQVVQTVCLAYLAGQQYQDRASRNDRHTSNQDMTSIEDSTATHKATTKSRGASDAKSSSSATIRRNDRNPPG